ncbi:C2 domain-containing protein [Babesia ovata]|uniref:C2 domain-containing protein n=1 Tax=Babesia ovata TaxID=189622 RepID=A0A2H6KF15_9APIC|nr:C2 domain-containing protein [Babesia ovata]GBE61549.1 C2 domain-containing protein [Babesia ovata]
MPRYSVSCTVHEALLPQQPGGTPVDPLVVMRCFGSERTTTVKSGKTTVACWDESFNWSNFELSQSAWNVGVLEFELQAANAFWRNSTLGMGALQLRLVCATRDGSYVGQLPLTAPNSVRVIGKLSVTVNVCDSLRVGGGTTAPLPLPATDAESNTDERTSLHVPPLLSPAVYRSAILDMSNEEYNYYHLYINIYTLEHVEVGMFAGSPSVTVEYGGCRLQSTKPIRSRCEGSSTGGGGISGIISGFFSSSDDSGFRDRSNFAFNQCFLVPIRTAVGKSILEDNIVVRVWMGMELNANLSSTDRPAIAPKMLAEGVFSLAKLRSRRQPPRWFNFYAGTAGSRRRDEVRNNYVSKTDGKDPDRDNAFQNRSRGAGSDVYRSHDSIGSASTSDSLVDGTPGGSDNTFDDRDDHYIGRMLMSASVKRLAKPSDVLVAHVQACHPLEAPVVNPTRLFGDAYCIESRCTFGFEGDFEIMLEISCGPHETRSEWLPAQRRLATGGTYAEELGIFGSNTDSGLKRRVSRSGWKVTLNSMNGRLAPIDLLVSHTAEEQWLVFVRINARGTVSGRLQHRVIGCASFPFDHIPEHSSKVQVMPLWIPLCCPGSTSTITSADSSSIGFTDPTGIVDAVSSIKAEDIIDQAAALDPTGLIGAAANEVLGRQAILPKSYQEAVSAAKSVKVPPPGNSHHVDIFGSSISGIPGRNGPQKGTTSQNNAIEQWIASRRPSQDKNRSTSDAGHVTHKMRSLERPNTQKTVTMGTRRDSTLRNKSTSDQSDAREPTDDANGPTRGDMCDPGATVNVLMTLHKHSFYTSMSRSIGVGNDIRTASRPRMVSMLKQDYELRCYVYCAHLSTAPHSGVAVMVSCDCGVAVTRVQRNFTRFPVFSECCTIPVEVPTLTSSRMVPPPPITVSLLFFDRRRKLLRIESAVTVYNRLVKSASGHAEAKDTATPTWLHLSGGSKVVMFTELVVSQDAPKVAKRQMAHLTTRCVVTLGLMGLRQLMVGAIYPLDGLLLRLTSQSYGANVECEQIFERQCPLGQSKWERGGRLNVDLFTVLEGSFHIPIDPLFDPHVEFYCYAMSGGAIGKLIGYQSFRCYAGSGGTVIEPELPMALDMRCALIPRRMTRLLDDLALRSSHDVLNLQDTCPLGGATRPLDGVPPVICDFESSRAYARLLRSMTFERVGMQVPPRFVVACDGKEAEAGAASASVGGSAEYLDAVLRDIPFTVKSIHPVTPVGSRVIDGKAANHGFMENVTMKYFLTVRHAKEGQVQRSYPEALSGVATSASKMLRVFRGGLRNALHKLRFCVVAAINTVPDCDALGSLSLLVEIGKSESREPLSCDRSAISKEVHRTWEQEIFLPEDSVIRLRVVNSFERLDNSLEDELIASAQIDLENRWYSKVWQRMLRNDMVPVERVLLRDRNNNVHGSLDVIVQLGPIELFSTLRPLSFAKSSPSVAELRVVVWSTSGVRLAATPEDARKKDQLDLYVVSTLDCQGYRGECALEQRTDIHYNCDSGASQFNWRLVYPEIHSPVGACQLQLAVFDFWKVGPPTFVGEATLELRQYVEIVSATSTRVELSGNLPLVHSSSSRPVGSLKVTVQVMTQAEASCSPVGLGRSQPNCKPFLPTPREGRQWNDWFAHTSLGFDFGALSLYVSLYYENVMSLSD